MNDHDARDPEEFRRVYRAHYRAVCRYLAARADRELVEDLAAETFLVAWRRQRELPDRHLLPWLLNTAGKCLANQRRSQKRAGALVERLSGVIAREDGGIEKDVARRAQLRAVLATLAALDEREREVLLLRYWDGLAPREIAVAMELSPMLVRARLHRASRRLRGELVGELEHVQLTRVVEPRRVAGTHRVQQRRRNHDERLHLRVRSVRRRRQHAHHDHRQAGSQPLAASGRVPVAAAADDPGLRATLLLREPLPAGAGRGAERATAWSEHDRRPAGV
jgi:RNA polymerase sigma factor (sigma-70 family)